MVKVRARSLIAPGIFYPNEGDMKRLLVFLLMAAVAVAHADNSKIAPELQNYPSSQQAQVIVQYAPGTTGNCSGLLGLVDCLFNDIVNLGGTILVQLPPFTRIVALLH